MKKIEFDNSNTINVIEMNEIFDGCKNLREINMKIITLLLPIISFFKALTFW